MIYKLGTDEARLVGEDALRRAGGTMPERMDEYISKPEVDQLARELYAEAIGMPYNIPYEVTQSVIKTYLMGRWVESGMPVFAPTQGLAASLVLTGYKGLEVAELPWPFKSFMVRIPRPWLAPPFDKLAQIWVTTATCLTGVVDDRMLLQPWRYEGETVLKPWVRVDVDTADAQHVSYHRQHVMDMGVDEWTGDSRVETGSEEYDPEEIGMMAMCHQLVAGLCLYIATNPLQEPDGGGKKRKKSKKPRKARVWTLGREVKLPAPMRVAASDFTRRRVDGAAWKLKKRYIVRGHFKRVRVGPRDDWEYKMRWIEPYWKGPEEGTVLERTYKVEE